jgi:hypothetical protein
MTDKAKQLGSEPAQPVLELGRYTDDCPFYSYTSAGLTKREYFAAMALSGILSDPAAPLQRSAIYAVEAAECLLEALANENKVKD